MKKSSALTYTIADLRRNTELLYIEKSKLTKEQKAELNELNHRFGKASSIRISKGEYLTPRSVIAILRAVIPQVSR